MYFHSKQCVSSHNHNVPRKSILQMRSTALTSRMRTWSHFVMDNYWPRFQNSISRVGAEEPKFSEILSHQLSHFTYKIQGISILRHITIEQSQNYIFYTSFLLDFSCSFPPIAFSILMPIPIITLRLHCLFST